MRKLVSQCCLHIKIHCQAINRNGGDLKAFESISKLLQVSAKHNQVPLSFCLLHGFFNEFRNPRKSVLEVFFAFVETIENNVIMLKLQ